MLTLKPPVHGYIIDDRSVDSVTSQLASAVLDSRGPLQYDDRSIGGTSGGGKGLPGGAGGALDEDDDANPWGDEEQVWALQEYVTKYKAQFDSVQKNGTIRSHTLTHLTHLTHFSHTLSIAHGHTHTHTHTHTP